MTRQSAVAFAAGALFALGLGLSGMTQPKKVIAFLDISGGWDPSLAFVMAGAIGVHLFANLRARSPKARPLLAERFDLPTSSRVDARLVAGATLFGLGWGAAGLCPGPAVMSAVTLDPSTLIFLGAMIVGMSLYTLIEQRLPAQPLRGDGADHHPQCVYCVADAPRR